MFVATYSACVEDERNKHGTDRISVKDSLTAKDALGISDEENKRSVPSLLAVSPFPFQEAKADEREVRVGN